jgi:hypothetical protein
MRLIRNLNPLLNEDYVVNTTASSFKVQLYPMKTAVSRTNCYKVYEKVKLGD